MNLDNARKIHGWTNELELAWLAEKASRCTNIAEVGSWQGRSTRAIADNTTGRVYACDTFKGTPEDGHYKLLTDKPEDWLYTEFTRNMEGLSNVVTLAMPSLDAAKLFQGPTFDMIFIDAAHDYDNVKADILAWRPLLKPGGLFCGHDFDAGRAGVVTAVRELIKNPRMAGAGSIWFEG